MQQPHHRPSFSSLLEALEGMGQMRALPIADEGYSVEDSIINRRVGEQEEYMSISACAQSLAQHRETVPVAEEDPGSEGEGGSEITSHIPGDEGESHNCEVTSASSLDITHTEEALPVFEDGSRTEGERTSQRMSQCQLNDAEEEHAGISATSLTQLWVEETVPATDLQDIPTKDSGGDVALLCHNRDHEQEEYVSISALVPFCDRATGTTHDCAHATVKVHLKSSQQSI